MEICLFCQLSSQTCTPHPALSSTANSFSLVCQGIVLLFYCNHAHVNTLELFHKSLCAMSCFDRMFSSAQILSKHLISLLDHRDPFTAMFERASQIVIMSL